MSFKANRRDIYDFLETYIQYFSQITTITTTYEMQLEELQFKIEKLETASKTGSSEVVRNQNDNEIEV